MIPPGTRRALPFTCRNLLAPMEGVTEPSFRERVLERNGPEALGGTFTEFCRVVRDPLPRRVLREHLGDAPNRDAPNRDAPNGDAPCAHEPRLHAPGASTRQRFSQPVGLQLMGSDREALARTAVRAVEVGAPLVDLNFGCPAKGALRGCAGAALLDDPRQVEALVSALRSALGEDVPLSAKIRAGGEDDTHVEELAKAVEAGGADLLTVHARTRREGYKARADWRRLERAVQAVSIPVCGNGGIESHADFERLRQETGCAFAMVGRAALGNPWIFSDKRVSRAEAAGFLVDYALGLMDANGSSLAGAMRRVKQLFNYWSVGELITEAPGEERLSWLRERDPEALLARLVSAGGPGEFEESLGLRGTSPNGAWSKSQHSWDEDRPSPSAEGAPSISRPVPSDR